MTRLALFLLLLSSPTLLSAQGSEAKLHGLVLECLAQNDEGHFANEGGLREFCDDEGHYQGGAASRSFATKPSNQREAKQLRNPPRLHASTVCMLPDPERGGWGLGLGGGASVDGQKHTPYTTFGNKCAIRELRAIRVAPETPFVARSDCGSLPVTSPSLISTHIEVGLRSAKRSSFATPLARP